MHLIVDCRLGDVYQARSSSHLIYAGSRHDPGCLRRSDEQQASREGWAGVGSRRAFGGVQREGSRSHVGREPVALAPQSGFPSADNSDVEHREILTLACPRCGESFPSAMQMDPTTFDVIRLESMLERCSACGHAARFRKDDYAFTSDRTSP